MNLYEKLSEWLLEYDMIGSWLYFNVTNVEVNNTSLNSAPGERYLAEYVDGSAEKELFFAVTMIKQYDEGTSNINIEALQECENLADWCEEQSEMAMFPDFGNAIVHKVTILDSAPSLSVDNEQNLAKYMIQGKVEYLKLKGE